MEDAVTTQTALIVGANVLLWVLAPVYVRLVGPGTGWREGRRLVPILVFTILLRKQLLRGITFGAVRK